MHIVIELARTPERVTPEALALEKCVLFRTLSEEDRAELAATAHRRHYSAKTPIFHIGDPGSSLMAVLEGTVRISMPAVNGREIILADLRDGDIFGEIALLDGLGRSADATALTEVTVLVLDRPDVMRFLAERPDACLRLLAIICGRLRLSDERMTDIASVELNVRLAKALLKQSPETTEAQSRVPLSQGELAGMVSSSREAVNRQLAHWQRSGLVSITSGRIEVTRRGDLALIAGLI